MTCECIATAITPKRQPFGVAAIIPEVQTQQYRGLSNELLLWLLVAILETRCYVQDHHW